MYKYVVICLIGFAIFLHKGVFFMTTATFWALLPPLIAIGLALATKEVYISLFIGIFAGALLFTNFNIITSVEVLFGIMSDKVGSNMNIIIFLVFLGILVALLQASGASAAYGDRASKSIHTERGALLATMGLGTLIFVDDYFNCLTVGTVMSPVTDKYKISRAKLAYIIDATAAPICIIAPISSWAAAVSYSLPEDSGINGFNLFLQTIPQNLYAILTIIMVLYIIVFKLDFGPMKTAQIKQDSVIPANISKKNGKVMDLVLPIAVLILFCITAMLYTGGFFDGVGVVTAFAECNASLALVIGSFFAIIFTGILYISRKVVTYNEFTKSITSGFVAMVPAILILTLAWTLSGICSADYLNAGGFVSGVLEGSSFSFSIVPAIFFVISVGFAFATGTSWGTFGILLPIAVTITGPDVSQIMINTVAAILAGAVCGDHISPISDTTILASTGADCSHIEHVSTQMPYALLVAGCCFIGYIISGFTGSWIISLIVSIALLIGLLFFLSRQNPAKA